MGRIELICQNHHGKQCLKEGREWNIRTLNNQQVLRVVLCNEHIKGEEYADEYYYERKSDKGRIDLDTAYLIHPDSLASDYTLEKRI